MLACDNCGMPVPKSTGRTARRLVRDDVYDRLLEVILDGTLQPGERIVDSDIEAWLGASRTPVRDAIARLERKGLVEIVPQRYSRIALIDAAQVRHHLEVLEPLILLAVEKATAALTPQERAQAARLSERIAGAQPGRERVGAVRELLSLWIARYGNAHLREVVEDLSLLVVVHLVNHPEMATPESAASLVAAADAAAAGDPAAAVAAVSEAFRRIDDGVDALP